MHGPALALPEGCRDVRCARNTGGKGGERTACAHVGARVVRRVMGGAWRLLIAGEVAWRCERIKKTERIKKVKGSKKTRKKVTMTGTSFLQISTTKS